MFTPKKTIGQLVAEAKSRIENDTTEDLRKELDRGGVQLLDIRDIRERQKLGWIPGSMHVPRGMLEFWLDPTSPYHNGRVDPEKRIILYCAGGGRSVLATDVLRGMGFPDLANYDEVWAAAGHAKTVFPTTFDELVRITGGTPHPVEPKQGPDVA